MDIRRITSKRSLRIIHYEVRALSWVYYFSFMLRLQIIAKRLVDLL